MDYQELFHDSFQRVFLSDGGTALVERFYVRFLASGDEVRERFRNTDMAAQRRMLKDSMALVTSFSATKRAGDYLERIARRHGGHDLDIPARLFDLWMDTLIETVREMDPRFGPNVEIAWRVMLAPGVEFMKGRSALG